MQPIWTLDEARAADRRAEEQGLPHQALLAVAGFQLARYVQRRVPDGPVVVLTGPGSNGGDGWVAARQLAYARPVTVMPVAAPRFSGADGWVRAATENGAQVRQGPEAEAALDRAAVVVDAVFGTGFHGSVVASPAGPWLERLARKAIPVIAADLPSGIDTNTGAYDGPRVNMLATVAMGALKWGLVSYPAADIAGDLVVADIGLSRQSFGDVPGFIIGPQWAKARFPGVSRLSQKYDRGRVAVVGGSRSMPGAPVLAAEAALKAGAGLVEVVRPKSAGGTSMSSALIAHAMPETDDGSLKWSDQLKVVLDRADALVIGPGLGTRTDPRLIAELASLKKPAVLDADGIRLARDGGVALPENWVMTPHAGELGYFLSRERSSINANRRQAVLDGTGRAGCPVLLKGRFTVISDGRVVLANPTGSEALATAGSGDVLSGMTASLLAQGIDGLDALGLAAYWHGWAGELGQASEGLSLTAVDLIQYIGPAAQAIISLRPAASLTYWE